nr:MAG TPA: hypothetical protein [Bacteriophage sp.]
MALASLFFISILALSHAIERHLPKDQENFR